MENEIQKKDTFQGLVIIKIFLKYTKNYIRVKLKIIQIGFLITLTKIFTGPPRMSMQLTLLYIYEI